MIYVSKSEYSTLEAVSAEYTSAAKIVSADGAWILFETITEYEQWLNQR
jgi:hypothetical protein